MVNMMIKRLVFMLALAIVVIPTLARPGGVGLKPAGDITTWPDTPYRWMDIADFLYATGYQDSFDYGQPAVRLSNCDIASTFKGTIIASGLKPNFAYQMKLVGKPTKVWEAGGDDWANEQIGYAGRWWRKQPNPGNANDTDYEAHKDDPSYIYEGYLLFDFIVTDELGSAEVSFVANSSFHVLWATPDSTGDGIGHWPRQEEDGSIETFDFTSSRSTHPDAYATDYGSATVSIYAEWEPGRALPGELVLPSGHYNVQLVLTEESFHQNGLGGFWAGAMMADNIRFWATDDAEADLDNDFDIDGADLAINVTNQLSVPLDVFAGQFGLTVCQQ
jgi:hypothetical protein